MTKSQREEYDIPHATRTSVDLTPAFDDAIAMLYWTALGVEHNENHKGLEAVSRAAHSMSLLVSNRSNNIDDHVLIAARDLNKMGRELYDNEHPLVRLGSYLIDSLHSTQSTLYASMHDIGYLCALNGIDSRGRPYGMPGAARLNVSHTTGHLLRSTYECLDAIRRNQHYEPAKEDIMEAQKHKLSYEPAKEDDKVAQKHIERTA